MRQTIKIACMLILSLLADSALAAEAGKERPRRKRPREEGVECMVPEFKVPTLENSGEPDDGGGPENWAHLVPKSAAASPEKKLKTGLDPMLLMDTAPEAAVEERKSVPAISVPPPVSSKDEAKISKSETKKKPKGEKSFICVPCGQEFDHKWQLEKHKTLASRGGDFKCPHCSHWWPSASSLGSHLKAAHLEEKPNEYACAHCSFTCRHKSKLEEHERFNLPPKGKLAGKFKCPKNACNHTFASAHGRGRHPNRCFGKKELAVSELSDMLVEPR